MTRLTRPRRLLAAIVIGVLATALAATAYADPGAPEVPAEIAVPAGHKVFLIAHAEGVQIYTCTTAGWRFVAPRANLYGDNGQLVATHFAGPSWQARDGSLVRATLDAPPFPVDPSAIPWLRLRMTSATAGPDGDRLALTTYIQRIATAGGVAPAPSSCDSNTVGTTAEVPYTADYVFWKANPA